jgi:hypothetical protein
MSTSLLEAHLARASGKTDKQIVARSERNFVTKARRDLAKKAASVQQAVHSIVLSNPKKKSRKLLKKIVKIQRDEKTVPVKTKGKSPNTKATKATKAGRK